MRRVQIVICVSLLISTVSLFLAVIYASRIVDVFDERIVLQDTYIQVRNAERAQRMYLLTGDRDHLLEYYTNEKNLKELNLGKLNLLISQKFDEMGRTIYLMDRDKKIQAIDLIKSNEGVRYMTMIEDYKTTILNKLERENRRYLIYGIYFHNTALLGATFVSIVSLAMVYLNQQRT